MHAQILASSARCLPPPAFVDLEVTFAGAPRRARNDDQDDARDACPESSVRPRRVDPAEAAARYRRATDAEIARAALEGDAEAARAIWKRYGLLVRAKLRRSIGTDEIDDHVQEVFLRFFERLPQLREHCALRNFLLGISLRVASTELRRRRMRRLRLTADGELPEGNVSTTLDYDAKEALSRFDALLTHLGPHQRTVFELRYVHEMELADIAAALGSSLATVKRHLARVSSRVFAIVERDPALLEYWRSSTLDRRRAADVELLADAAE